MKFYVVLDELGLPTAFYRDDIHAKIPSAAKAITESQWAEFVEHPGARRFVDGAVVEYVPVPTDTELASQIRAQRDRLLAETDYLLMPDYPIAGEALDALAVYRQALRDITKQDTFPAAVSWPEKPEI